MRKLHGEAKSVRISGGGVTHPPAFTVGESRGTFSQATGIAGVETCTSLHVTVNGPQVVTVRSVWRDDATRKERTDFSTWTGPMIFVFWADAPYETLE